MRIALVLLFCFFLSGCLPASEPQVVPADTSQAPEKEANTEMRDAIQAPIEKAEKVEDQVLDGAEKQNAEIEAAGG